MNRYAYCPEGVVLEIIPEFDPIFPGVPIEDRYSPTFLALCIFVPDGIPVESGWIYDPETNTFSAPPEPEPEPETENQA